MVADVGGTHTRIALFDPAANELRALTIYRNREHARFEDVIALWLEALEESAPRHCCIAVAAPPSGDRVSMVNMHWSFSCREIAGRFGFRRFRRINDFESNAYALPHLGAADTETLQGRCTDQPGKLAAMGPGTGLGGATLEWLGGTPRATACEPGQMGLSPATAMELELFRLLLLRHRDIHAELLVSGPGLQRIHAGLAELRGERAEELIPAEISARALSGADELCGAALSAFCALLGSACGDFVLGSGAYGGLYLAGGIVPGMIPFLRASAFRQRFREKGAMCERLAGVPIRVITRALPGLLGAAHAPLREG
jgi:glucokinase